MEKEVTVSIPFTYTLGEYGFYTDKKLMTEQDCVNEAVEEIRNGALEHDIYFNCQTKNKGVKENNRIYKD